MDDCNNTKKRSLLSSGNMSIRKKKKKKNKVQRGGVLKECYKDETSDKIQYTVLTNEDDSIQVQQVPIMKDDDTTSLRIIPPYPYLFSTFAKDRWIGKSILNVYTHEFGTYPKCYYERAINDGLIFVNRQKVSVQYPIQRGDELCHVIHRHEPPVLMKNNNHHELVVYEDEHVMAVDKVSTMPIHPCGAYHFNTLCNTLPNVVFPIHRLDRLTSGIVVLAKSKQVAASLSSYFSQQPTRCHKYYLAQVHGQFPMSLTTTTTTTSNIPKNNDSYWIQTNKTGKRSSLDAFVTSSKHSIVSILQDSHDDDDDSLWLYVDRPLRPSSYKDGTWKCCSDSDTDGKSAKTAFGIVSHDEKSNTTLVIAKPITGRTHQIRLHLQYLGHSILYDDVYPQTQNHTTTHAPNHVPVTIQDLQNITPPKNSTSSNNDLLQHVQQSCVWCAKEKTQTNIVDNFLQQNQGIHLHALKYHIPNWVPPNSANNIPKDLNLYTNLPKWAIEHSS